MHKHSGWDDGVFILTLIDVIRVQKIEDAIHELENAQQSTKHRCISIAKSMENRDISLGKERMAITWVNDVDDELPPFFEYITAVEWTDPTMIVEYIDNTTPCICTPTSQCQSLRCDHLKEDLIDTSFLFPDTGFYDESGSLCYISNAGKRPIPCGACVYGM